MKNQNRFLTREVFIGSVAIGAQNPIRIQSMTTSDTKDVHKTVDQIIKLNDEGCEIVRVTVQGKKEAYACELIKNALLQKGYTIPIVADIHFYPPAALIVIDFVDKVRINPGNFVDKRAVFKKIIYTQDSYQNELIKIEEKFYPLIEKCKAQKKALRIGTNHGSLSDRIMSYFGDTPKGMVESAFEFARICRKYDFHNLIFSMKSSNPLVMIEAYRLLVSEMQKIGWDYPLHLGVTEAGEGEDGRIKSSVGTGSLLLDGIGDTIRISLTEDPWKEIGPCKKLLKHIQQISSYPLFTTKTFQKVDKKTQKPFHESSSIAAYISSLQDFDNIKLWPDFFLSDASSEMHISLQEKTSLPIFFKEEFDRQITYIYKKTNLRALQITSVEDLQNIALIDPAVLFIKPLFPYAHNIKNIVQSIPFIYSHLPVIACMQYESEKEQLVISSSADIGSLLCDSFIDGICIQGNLATSENIELSFSIMQACRRRIVKTEYISCPGCGRTLFDLQSVSKRIREKTSHLSGVKIAIMGCIVNGPGEMADADFGYVGSSPGKIDLYVGKKCVEKNIPFDQADQKLIELIKSHGKWKEPTYKTKDTLAVLS